MELPEALDVSMHVFCVLCLWMGACMANKQLDEKIERYSFMFFSGCMMIWQLVFAWQKISMYWIEG